MQRCNCCGEVKTANEFPLAGKQQDGSPKRRKTCKPCYAGRYTNKGREAERDRFNRLISWPAVIMTVVFTGIFSYEYLSGRNRICVYDTIRGEYSMTIDAMEFCPLKVVVYEQE